MTKVFLLLAMIFTYLLMVVGGLVTSSGSGLGCPDWPLCYGTVVPPPKVQAWIEWSHRLLASLTSLFIIISTVLVWKNYKGLVRYTSLASVLFLIVQIALGGLVVLTESPKLEGFKQVLYTSSHIVVSTLILIFVASTLSLLIHEGEDTGVPFGPLTFLIVYLQILLGILVRYGKAGLACLDWPTCNGKLIPSFDTYAILLQFLHRNFAILVFLYLLFLVLKRPNFRTLVLLLLVGAQFTFGVLSVLSKLFLPIVMHHVIIGFFLLLITTYYTAPTIFRGETYGKGATA